MLAATFLMVGAFDVLVVVLAVGSLGIGELRRQVCDGSARCRSSGSRCGFTSLALVGRARIVPVMLGAAVLGASGGVHRPRVL